MGADSTWIDCNTKGNAALIAEAGTVHHETGLTPHQLVEQRDALAEALQKMLDAYERSKPPGYPVSDRERAAREALALVKGATP